MIDKKKIFACGSGSGSFAFGCWVVFCIIGKSISFLNCYKRKLTEEA